LEREIALRKEEERRRQQELEEREQERIKMLEGARVKQEEEEQKEKAQLRIRLSKLRSVNIRAAVENVRKNREVSHNEAKLSAPQSPSLEDSTVRVERDIVENQLEEELQKAKQIERKRTLKHSFDAKREPETPTVSVASIVAPSPKAVAKAAAPLINDPKEVPGSERARRLEWNAESSQWIAQDVILKIEAKPFAKGSIREAYKAVDVNKPDEALVVKISMKRNELRQVYESDVTMQMLCCRFAEEYNKFNPPKPVNFLMAWLLELVDRPGAPLAGMERFIDGNYRKYNNNSGMVMDDRNTPQAFSHFTYENSDHELVVVDVQGVQDFYTDPQIHSSDGKGYGVGNLGKMGIDRFLSSHVCNAICQSLQLPLLGQQQKRAKRLLLNGTMFFPQDLAARLHGGLRAKQSVSSPIAELKPDIVIRFHEEAVTALAVHPDGKTLYSATEEGRLCMWDLTSNDLEKPVKQIKSHRGVVNALLVDDKYLYSCGDDKSVMVWDNASCTLVDTLNGHESQVRALAHDSTYLFSGANDKTIMMWRKSDFEIVASLEGHEKAVRSLIVIGEYLFSGSNDNTIKMWDIATQRVVYSLNAHKNWVKALAGYDLSLYSAAFDKRVKKWDLLKLQLLHNAKQHTAPVNALVATKNYLFSGSEDSTLKVWDVREGLECIGTYKVCASGPVLSMCASSKYLFTGAADNKIKGWTISQ
jgi:myosin-heavy-chain kinase